jgi:hypothetical protein
MAITKIKPVKGALKQALSYIQNPDKTDEKMLVSSFGCAYETAYEEFEITLSKAIQKGNNLAHHLIQSFEPGESSPEQAHEIGKRLADEITKGRHEYVLTTHIDKGHIHNHLIFCAASFIDYKKYISNKKSYFEIRNASDKLCKEYDLSVVTPGQEKGKSYAEYAADRDGGSWKSKLKIAINNLIPESKNLEDFLQRLQKQGYEIKRGKYISVRASGQERFTRTKTLGADFTEDAITKRIALAAQSPEQNEMKSEKHAYTRPIPAANLIIDLENNVKAQQNAGFARWQKIQNLKEAAKTLNFLTENNLLQYVDLEAKAVEVTAAFDTAAESLNTAENRLAEMATLMKHIENYQQTKPIYDGFKTSKDKNAYRRENKNKIILHETAAKALKSFAGEGGKLPNPVTLQAEYSRLAKKKNILRAEYGKLKNQAREYGIIKKNVDSILNPITERTRRKELEL